MATCVRLDPDALRLYNEHFHHVDPYAMSPVARAAGPGVCATDEMFVARAELIRSEYFNDFAIRFDNTKLLSALIQKDPGAASAITVLRGRHGAQFGANEMRVLQAVAPHLRRALQIHKRIHGLARERAAAFEALDTLPCALFFVDADAKIVLTNRRGHNMLAARDGLATDGGRLQAALQADTKRLRETCAAVAARQPSGVRHAGGAIAIGRPSGPPLQALVTPAPSARPLGLVDDRVAALVFVTDPADEDAPSEPVLRQLYGLTPAESHVAARLAIGRSLEEIAAERGSAVETVRRQNKQILAKTGTRRRSELVLLLSRTPRG